MTEDEAKTKWCPMIRWQQAGSSGMITNRGSVIDPAKGVQHSDVILNRCIASDCMMWRWIRTPSEVRLEKAQKFMDEEPGNVECEAEGQCGLAPWIGAKMGPDI